MYAASKEKEIAAIITSCVVSYGQHGVPLDEIEEEFEALCGYPIPYKNFGFQNVRNFLSSLPHIYIIKDKFNNDVVIEQSPKLYHIKNLMSKQRDQTTKKRYNLMVENKIDFCYKEKRRMNSYTPYLPKGCSIHSSFNSKNMIDSRRFEEFQKLEEMLPVLYKHQAIGDDFFVDLADKKLGCYVVNIEKTNMPGKCGLCEVGMTISDLTEKIENAERLAPRVVVMVGMNDLLKGRNANSMIIDLRKMVTELRKRNTRVTLVTLIPSPNLKRNPHINLRMEIFNKAILEYGTDLTFQCNIIDMNKIFQHEVDNFKKDFDRLTRIGKNDPYKVFSDYGRKIFLNALKTCLKEQIEHGH
ncbi:hypothetical protein WA026_010498 [Henosepilachna vigintioctopunctata]|uniref:HTH OST-type domain-containing protein n=1 Tax=Henosepilachna vigintioctopunctata TaxID=420089 RepID=A0AAW1V5T1_9CUCU